MLILRIFSKQGKGIVEGLGGEIRLESVLGKGTNVYFTIPIGEL